MNRLACALAVATSMLVVSGCAVSVEEPESAPPAAEPQRDPPVRTHAAPYEDPFENIRRTLGETREEYEVPTLQDPDPWPYQK